MSYNEPRRRFTLCIDVGLRLQFDTIEEAVDYKRKMDCGGRIIHTPGFIEPALTVPEENLNINYIREMAMKKINAMTPREFQEKLLTDTLPDFIRKEQDISIPLELHRSTYHPYRKMTEEEFLEEDWNQGFIHRYELEWLSVLDFKLIYYHDIPRSET